MGALFVKPTPLYAELDAPTGFTKAMLVPVVTSAALVVFYVVASYTVFLGYREARKRAVQLRKTRSAAARITFWILFHLVANLLTQVQQQSVMFHLDYSTGPGMELVCRGTHKLSAGLYVLGMFGNYQVLVIRAEAMLTTTKMMEKNRFVKLLFLLTKYTTLLGLPAIAGVATLLFEGRVMFGSICAQDVSLLVVVLFTVSDSLLSLAFLLLFLIPVYKFMKEMGEGSAQAMEGQVNELRRRARRNLRLSAYQIVSTFTAQVLGAVCSGMLRPDAPELEFLRFVALAAYMYDTLINSVALLYMSSAWIPASWSRAQRIFVEDQTQSGTTGSSKRSNLKKVAPNKRDTMEYGSTSKKYRASSHGSTKQVASSHASGKGHKGSSVDSDASQEL